MEVLLKIFLLIVCIFNGISGQERTHYIGAVVDFASQFDKSDTPATKISKNFDNYEIYIKKAAAQKADIIVFPECGLTSINLPTTVSNLLPFASVIPDPLTGSYNPCDKQSSEWTRHMRSLSCAAKTNNIYLVVNLPERLINNSSKNDETDLIFNTNIVFDRSGKLIARYRKYNLFVEPGFSRTQTAELITFKTDFGVTFGTFICFDILFKSPSLDILSQHEDVTDIVYPTAWFSELPFLTAVQTQAGWARANGVNLLAAGYNYPENKNGGSGIYTVDGNLTYIMPTLHESSIITSKIPIINKRLKVPIVIQHKFTPSNLELEGMAVLEENLSNYTTNLLNKSVNDYRLCHNEFCCVFDVKFTEIKNADYYYRLVVYSGVRVFGELSHDIQVCGVAACTDNTVNSCGKRATNPTNPITFDAISVKGDMFNSKNSTFIPSYTDYYLGTNNLYYYNATVVNKYKVIEMKNLEPVTNVLGFGVYGTTFNSSASLTNLSSLLVTIIVACFIVKIIN